jgi:hypothetical protein
MRERCARGRLLRAFALVSLAGCGGLHPPVVDPSVGGGVARARASVERAVAGRSDVRLVEGGLILHAMVYERRASRRWKAADPSRTDIMLDPRDPWVVEEDVLVGPRELYVPLARLEAVWVREWAVGEGVELELAGEPERVVLRVGDRAEAERLAAALEALRRAVAGEGAAPR